MWPPGRRRPLLPGVVLAVLAAACGGESGSAASLGPDRGDDEPPAQEESAPAGDELYRRNCASCHGEDGAGGFGPSLAGVTDRLTVEEHIAVVRDGRGQMPGWEDSLGPEEIEAVVDYERTALSEQTSEEERP